MFYQFERDVRSNATSGKFGEGGDISFVSSPISTVAEHDGRPCRFLPSPPVIANTFRFRAPAAQRILFEPVRVLEAEPIALFVICVSSVGVCIRLWIIIVAAVVISSIVVAAVTVVVVVGSAAARTIPLLNGPSSSTIRLRSILVTGPSPTSFLLLAIVSQLDLVRMLLLLRLLPLWWPLRATPSSVRSVCQLRLS